MSRSDVRTPGPPAAPVLSGPPSSRAEVKDIMWLAPSGQEMTEVEWRADRVKCLGVRLSGDDIGDVDENGTAILGYTILHVMNASPAPVPFTLPSFAMRPRWETVQDAFDEGRVGEVRGGGAVYPLCAHSLAGSTPRRDRNDQLS